MSNNTFGLILDFSYDPLFLILSKDGKKYSLKNILKNESSKVLPILDSFLIENHLSIKDLSFIATSTGPGSFMGMRSALAISQAICFSQNIPLLSFSHMHGLLPFKEGKYFAILSAKLDGLYVLKGEKTANECIFNEPFFLLEKEKILSFFKKEDYLISNEATLLSSKTGLFIEQVEINYDFFCFFCNKKFLEKDFAKDLSPELFYF